MTCIEWCLIISHSISCLHPDKWWLVVEEGSLHLEECWLVAEEETLLVVCILRSDVWFAEEDIHKPVL